MLSPPRAIDEAAQPTYAVWEITLKCDLSCKHCGSRAGKARPDELTTAEALDLVDQLAAMGVREVTLIGGEVYLRSDWLEIVRRLKSRDIICTVVTGGRGFTRELAEKAKAAGVASVSVSVDGAEATHDRLRGAHGSYRAAMSALESLAEAGLQRSVNTQINAWNFGEIREVLDLVSATGIVAWQVQLTVAMARAADDASLLLRPHMLIELMPILARLKGIAERRGIVFWSGNNVGYFGPYERLFYDCRPGKHHTACAAGSTAMGIEANGDVKGCPSLPTADYVGGNIRDLSLETIWRSTAPLRFTRGRTTDDLWGFCKTCYYASECLGGCSWTSHVLFGRRGNNPFCHHRALELLAQGKREALVRVAAPPGHPFDYGRFELRVEDWPEEERAAAERIAATPID